MNCPNCGAIVNGTHCEYCGSHFNQIGVCDFLKPIDVTYKGRKMEMFIAEIEEQIDVNHYGGRDIDGKMVVGTKPKTNLILRLVER